MNVTSSNASAEFYSSESVPCNEECQTLEKCICWLCKCYLNCDNKCKCDFAYRVTDA